MRVLVHGAAGQMGTVLRRMIGEGCRGSVLAGAVDERLPESGLLPSLDSFQGNADCIIDFSHHSTTRFLTDYAVRRKLPLVIATTGQTEEEQELICQAARKIPVFCSGNMSLGVALLAELVRMTVKMFPDADVEIVEQHHNRKVDVPSGTALMLAQAVQSVRADSTLNIGRHKNGKRIKQEIGIHSLRMGNTVGIHEVIVNTGTQIITLKHEAQERALFAEGALAAADFLVKQRPGLYNINHIVNEV